ncbi:Heavy-metal-associated domain-containing protein [Azospirillaceae bacterium]
MTTYRVEGMTCQGCAKSVSNAITRLAPTVVVTVDVARSEVSIAGAVAPDTVEQAVTEAGFEYHGKKAS